MERGTSANRAVALEQGFVEKDFSFSAALRY